MNPRKSLGMLALCALSLGWSAEAHALSNCIKEPRKPPYTVAWADIYLAPTWMTQTTQDHERHGGRTEEGRPRQGLHDPERQRQRHPANSANSGDDRRQHRRDHRRRRLAHARSTASSPRPARKGIAVISFDSPIETNDITTKIEVSTKSWGETTAKWMIDQLGGKGDILVLNGPGRHRRQRGALGRSRRRCSTRRRASRSLAISNTEYNVAPAEQSVSSLLYAHPERRRHLVAGRRALGRRGARL